MKKLIILIIILVFLTMYLLQILDAIEWNRLKTENIIYIFTTLILAATAIFHEYLEQIISKPELEIEFANYPPFSHQTVMDFNKQDVFTGKIISVLENIPVYYFSLLIINRGTKQAKNCEVVLEGISKKDKNGDWIEEKYLPTNLRWVVPDSPQFISINPKRSIYCNIGHILKPEYQDNEPSAWRLIPAEEKNKPMFKLELMNRFYYQRDFLSPGEYKIKVAVYSENSEKKEKSFNIKWTGEWKSTEEEMLDKEIKIG